jgi:hypothetical protein
MNKEELTRKQKRALAEKNRRAEKSKNQVGYVRSSGGQPTPNLEQKTLLHDMLLEDIKSQIHHPLVWLCEKVFFFFALFL